MASVNRASPVTGALLSFCVNQGISASFSLLYSLTDAVHPEGIPGSCWGWTPVKTGPAQVSNERPFDSRAHLTIMRHHVLTWVPEEASNSDAALKSRLPHLFCASNVLFLRLRPPCLGDGVGEEETGIWLVGSYFPHQGLNSGPLAEKVLSPTHWTTREFPWPASLSWKYHKRLAFGEENIRSVLPSPHLAAL